MQTEHTKEQLNELQALVERIARYQGKTSDAQWCRRYEKYIGTTRTWKDRLRAGKLEEVDVPGKIRDLGALILLLEGGGVNIEIYDDLNFCRRFLRWIDRLEGTHNDRRILAVLGAIGVGKSCACIQAIRATGASDYRGQPRRYLAVPTVWRENKLAILDGLCALLNCMPERAGAASAYATIVAYLRANPCTIILDEAHQGGVLLMRIIKDLVNATSSHFVYVALQTEFNRVRSANVGALIEAKQFLRRCAYVFEDYVSGTKATEPNPRDPKKTIDADAVLFLRHQTGLDLDDCRSLATANLGSLRTANNLSTLADAVTKARFDAEDTDDYRLTPDRLDTAIKALTTKAA